MNTTDPTDVLGPLRTPTKPPEHPRDAKCRAAATELAKFIVGWSARNEMTASEVMLTLASLSHRMAADLVLHERKGGG